MEHFGNYLYQLRTKKGLYISQQRLSELTGYTQTYISLVETEKARPSKKFVKLITEAIEEDENTTRTC